MNTDFEQFRDWLDAHVFQALPSAASRQQLHRGRQQRDGHHQQQHPHPHFPMGSKEYDEFWAFAKQYGSRRRPDPQPDARATAQEASAPPASSALQAGPTDKDARRNGEAPGAFDFPPTYSASLKCNATVLFHHSASETLLWAAAATAEEATGRVERRGRAEDQLDASEAQFRRDQPRRRRYFDHALEAEQSHGGERLESEQGGVGRQRERFQSHEAVFRGEVSALPAARLLKLIQAYDALPDTAVPLGGRGRDGRDGRDHAEEEDQDRRGHSHPAPSWQHSRRRAQAPSEADVEEFRSLLSLFECFLQRQRYAKFLKIQSDRESLPIHNSRNAILQAIASHQVVVIAADTAAGKSTQVPQFLLESGYTKIACTQPRRIACISLCHRVSYETLNAHGSGVAYQIRFEGTRAHDTRVLFLTEGLLLRQISSDPLLERYNVVIVDEVHERHLSSDFLLGILRYILPQRPDLRLVLMSATINVELFSGYFGGCPIVRVPGRLYPIAVEFVHTNALSAVESRLGVHQGKKSAKSSKIDTEPYIRILERIDREVPKSERGDVLVFLSGMADMVALAEDVRAYAAQSKSWIVLLLHSALSAEEQDRVFDIAPSGFRKCVLSTNISETSVTIDGIRFVVDSGKVKEMAYDPEYKMQRLQEFSISRASAEQRKGRAGRTGPGMCFRLYSKQEYEQFLDFSVPEIQRVPLDSVVLQVMAMGGKPRHFHFVENPPLSAIESSIDFLVSHGAVSRTFVPAAREPTLSEAAEAVEAITPLGRILCRFPVDITIGKMLVLASIFDIVEPVAAMAACLTVSPFSSVLQQYQKQRRARPHPSPQDASGSGSAAAPVAPGGDESKPFVSPHGDSLTNLNAYYSWLAVKMSSRSAEASRAWCRSNGLEEKKLYEISKLARQFAQILVQERLSGHGRGGGDDNDDADDDDADEEEEGDDNDDVETSVEEGADGFVSFSSAARLGGKPGASAAATEREKLFLSRQLKAARRQLNVRKSKLLRPEDDTEFDDTAEAGESESSHGGGSSSSSSSSLAASVHLDHLDFRIHSTSRRRVENPAATPKLHLLKAILCYGLYPNLALPDANNLSRKDSEQVFHTKAKLFAMLHPQSVFASDPTFLWSPFGGSFPSQGVRLPSSPLPPGLAPSEHESQAGPSHASTDPARNLLLSYVSLLETSKPFLINTTAVPALQSLCLSSQDVVVSKDCRRIVFDRWIEARLPSEQVGAQALSQAFRVRYLWEQLVLAKLEGVALVSGEGSGGSKSTAFLSVPGEVSGGVSGLVLLNAEQCDRLASHPSPLVSAVALSLPQLQGLCQDARSAAQVLEVELTAFMQSDLLPLDVRKAKQSELSATLPAKGAACAQGIPLASWLVYDGFVGAESGGGRTERG